MSTKTLETCVAEAMTPTVVHCRPDASLRDVAQLMTTRGIHAVYVFDDVVGEDEPPALWGLVTDLDLVAAWPVLDERSAGGTAVTQLMAESGTAHLAVTDPLSGAPVGVLSTLDIARVIADGSDLDVA
jgi:CBS domain-containing protein